MGRPRRRRGAGDRRRLGQPDAGVRARRRTRGARALSFFIERRHRKNRALPIPIPRCGLARSTCWNRLGDIWPLAVPLLSDPVRGVRVRGADLLAAVPAANQLAADRRAFDRATAEFVAAQLLNADRPEARLTLGSFHARRGETAEAEAEYKAALRIAPQFAPAAVNLAAFIGRRRGAVGEVVLRAAIAASPKDAGLHYALGLALIRLKRSGDALTELQKAAKLAPENVHCANVYGIALNSTGQAITRERRWQTLWRGIPIIVKS
jgi:tetratricopeptide (TPR) repeat protein